MAPDKKNLSLWSGMEGAITPVTPQGCRSPAGTFRWQCRDARGGDRAACHTHRWGDSGRNSSGGWVSTDSQLGEGGNITGIDPCRVNMWRYRWHLKPKERKLRVRDTGRKQRQRWTVSPGAGDSKASVPEHELARSFTGGHLKGTRTTLLCFVPFTRRFHINRNFTKRISINSKTS